MRRSSVRPSSHRQDGVLVSRGLIAAIALVAACEFPIIVNVETVAEEPVAGQLYPLSGDYVLTMRTGLGQLSFAATAEFTVGAPAIAFSLQPLSATECTGTQAPIGERYAVQAPVNGGLFTLGLTGMDIPGASTSFSCSEPQLIGDMSLVGAVESEDLLYGVFDVELNEPQEMSLSGPFTGARPAASSAPD